MEGVQIAEEESSSDRGGENQYLHIYVLKLLANSDVRQLSWMKEVVDCSLCEIDFVQYILNGGIIIQVFAIDGAVKQVIITTRQELQAWIFIIK